MIDMSKQVKNKYLIKINLTSPYLCCSLISRIMTDDLQDTNHCNIAYILPYPGLTKAILCPTVAKMMY